jgi:site-specific DNA-methyltransferase (adenine-specific)
MIELNKIYNESNLETMSKMPDNFVDLTVTSPPYDDLRDYKGYSFPFEDIAKELYRITKEGGVVVWVVGDATINGSETGTSFKQALYFKEIGFNLHDTMIYHRISPFPDAIRYHQSFEYMFVFSKGKLKTFNGLRENKSKNSFTSKKTTSYRGKDGEVKKADKKAQTRLEKSLKDKTKLMSNVWYIPTGYGVSTTDKDAFKHPAIFPEDLVSKHIISWSNEYDLVYDCFMGSGTTAKMAHIYKRNWIGSEMSKEYVDIANKRLYPYLSQTTIFDIL